MLNPMDTSIVNINNSASYTSPDLNSPKRICGTIYSDQALTLAIKVKRTNASNASGAYATVQSVAVAASTQTSFDYSISCAVAQIVISNASGSNTTDFSYEVYGYGAF